MALFTAWRGLASRCGLAAASGAATWHTAAAQRAAALHTSPPAPAGGPGASSSPGAGPDPFTASLQSKTEAELIALLQQRLAAQAAEEGADDSGGESDADDGVNKETGAPGRRRLLHSFLSSSEAAGQRP